MNQLTLIIVFATVFLCSVVMAITLIIKGNREFGPDMSDWSPLCAIGSGACAGTAAVTFISAIIVFLPTPH